MRFTFLLMQIAKPPSSALCGVFHFHVKHQPQHVSAEENDRNSFFFVISIRDQLEMIRGG